MHLLRARTKPVFLTAAFSIVFAALFISCSTANGPVRIVIALDEAFSEARPTLAARLRGSALGGFGLVGKVAEFLSGGPVIVPISLNGGAGTALDTALAERRRTGRRVILATSPLVARAIIDGGSWSGDPPLLVPEWRGSPAQGLWTVSTDPVPAYREAGAAVGAFIAALAGGGGAPSCGVLFSQAPSRPREALVAFASAYAEASGSRTLLVRELAGKDTEAAVTELLGQDIRVLFVALGADSGTAIRQAARPDLAIGSDLASPESLSSLAFRILPDDESLARTMAAQCALIMKGGRVGLAVRIPARLVKEPFADRIRAGKYEFGSFLTEAALRAKALR
jgi:hypothetical protein